MSFKTHVMWMRCTELIYFIYFNLGFAPVQCLVAMIFFFFLLLFISCPPCNHFLSGVDHLTNVEFPFFVKLTGIMFAFALTAAGRIWSSAKSKDSYRFVLKQSAEQIC